MESNFDLERIFGTSIDDVDNVIAHMDDHIKHFSIPKKDGTKRNLIAPDDKLKLLQQRINWMVLMKYSPTPNAHGFVKRRSIVSNAKMHLKPNALGHIDIKSFFDMINEKHVSNCLFGNKNVCRLCRHYDEMCMGKCNPSIYYNRKKKYTHGCEELKAIFIPGWVEKTGYQSLFQRITKLCTYKNSAAQGFPTSPYFANIVLRGFDKKLEKVANDNECVYTRYADDLTFSSKTKTAEELHEIFKDVSYRTLWAFGFEANKKKTYWKDKGRFRVCGVVVNDKLNIAKEAVHRFRATVHHAIVKNAKRTTKSYVRKLKGWASYFCSVNPGRGQKYAEQLREFERGKWGEVV